MDARRTRSGYNCILRSVCSPYRFRAGDSGGHWKHYDSVPGKKWISLKTAAGMAAAGGALGPIIPPSIPMIIYGVTMGISIPQMFVAGIVPGLFLLRC